MKTFKNKFAITMRKYRVRKSLQQGELARLIGTSRVSICNYESSTQEPRLGIAMKIADALGFDINEIKGE